MGENKRTVKEKFIVELSEVSMADVPLVGGKNASLGELISTLKSKGINVPEGFATTTFAFYDFLYANKLKEPIAKLLSGLDRKNFSNLRETGSAIRELILNAPFQEELENQIKETYKKLCDKYGEFTDVAVRSSATSEDLPSASFAGQHQSFLHITREKNVLDACHQCYASLYTDRAIKYREDQGYGHTKIALSVGVQKMVRSDYASSGVCFTLEPESGFREVIHIAGSWGLGENIVQGTVTPDEFFVFKPTFKQGKNAIISKKLGSKTMTMIYAEDTDHEIERTIVNIETKAERRNQFVLNDTEINKIAGWALIIEDHYKKPMDIEWAKDGISGELFIVQARPETTHSNSNSAILKMYELKEHGRIITSGIAIGSSIASGKARIIHSPAESSKLQEGEILVTEITNPDWDPILKKVSAIVTEKGGRTSHASIVARELGVAAVVGTNNAIQLIKDGQEITVSCSEGKTGFIYDGKLDWKETAIDFSKVQMPKTQVMLILGDPEKAFKYSFYPNNGIGLMRLEFIISNAVQIHPMALVKFDTLTDKDAKDKIQEITGHYTDKKEYFIDKLSQAVATIAAAFYPKEVIVRMSDFKTNEYANLIGGKEFEPKEENPMIGFRGASRYYNERYKEGFRLECLAMKRVREEMGLTNVKLMIPFCRTIKEAKKVIAQMREFGLKRGENDLEVYMMAEIPSNVILAEEFAKHFDGFSIGSNDLTQLTLGIDRDSSIISNLFDEKNEAAEKMISQVIRAAKKAGIKIGLCGQAPSDFPEYTQLLVENGIDSISFNPDAIIKGIENINLAESVTSIVAKWETHT